MITVENYLDFKDTLSCGQVFRYFPKDLGYIVISGDKCAYVYNKGNKAYIDTDNEPYFENYFDLSKDYAKIIKDIALTNIPKVIAVSQKYSGIRILKQEKEEAFFSFIISQNNNIPRIKSIIEKLSVNYGKKFDFRGDSYYAFPTAKVLSQLTIEQLQSTGLGYRAPYIKESAQKILSGEIDFCNLDKLSTVDLKLALLKIKGIGDKVANCITLFGFNRSDSFPVDTWIEKIYREDFNGTLSARAKINQYFLDLFKENSGYVQQYLFYAKREGYI